AAEKPAFRDAMRWRRCLILADGFYEWKRFGPKEKQPYNFGMADDSPFAFAGLWDRWLDQDNKAIETCAILTTKPNSLVADVHDRMPEFGFVRSEEHTSELQSRGHLVCRLLLEKKKKKTNITISKRTNQYNNQYHA